MIALPVKRRRSDLHSRTMNGQYDQGVPSKRRRVDHDYQDFVALPSRTAAKAAANAEAARTAHLTREPPVHVPVVSYLASCAHSDLQLIQARLQVDLASLVSILFPAACHLRSSPSRCPVAGASRVHLQILSLIGSI